MRRWPVRRGLAAEGRAYGGGRWTALGAALLAYGSRARAWRLRHEACLRRLRRKGVPA